MFVVIGACAAALIAHIGVDVLGDYLLPHDTYDDIAHASRTALSCLALLGIAVSAFTLIHAGLDDARAGKWQRVLANPAPRWSGVYVAFVVIATFAILAAMELADLRLAGASVDDVGDLLGGSLWLGASTTLVVAVAVALGMWRIASWAAGARETAIRLLATWFISRAEPGGAARLATRRPAAHVASLPVLTRSTSKRGPPLFR